MEQDLRNDLERVAKARIYFVHQSVGNNLIEGLEELQRGSKTPLRIVSIDESKTLEGPWFAHASGGQNKHPQTKLDFFAQALDDAPELALAFVKLCYVDIDPSRDVDDLFASYISMIDTVKRKRPDHKIAHITTPLTARRAGAKQLIKQMLGRMDYHDSANIKRYRYNQKLLLEYGGDSVFDLARMESTAPDGRRTRFAHHGCTYYRLFPQYTDDGGHLNALGRHVVAREFLRFLARTVHTSS